jgi:uncharacterized protein (TIGR04222 family)
MNPFDMPGPQFLGFYLVLGTALLAGLVWLRRSGEPDPSMPVSLTDPYQIAYLRGGANEVLRLATAGLIDRGLLAVNENRVRVANEALAKWVNHPVDRAVLAAFQTEREAASLFKNTALRSECDRAYAPVLAGLGVMLDGQVLRRMRFCSYAILGILWLTAGIKIEVAWQGGHSNIGYLGLLMVAFTWVTFWMSEVRRTRRGDLFLQHMSTLLSDSLQTQSSGAPRVGGNELMILAAVFGLTALPATAFPQAKMLFARAVKSGSTCGSTWSHSCGHGGCGGGGGGCGGCGG